MLELSRQGEIVPVKPVLDKRRATSRPIAEGYKPSYCQLKMESRPYTCCSKEKKKKFGRGWWNQNFSFKVVGQVKCARIFRIIHHQMTIKVVMS